MAEIHLFQPGGATEAKQDTANASLSSIVTQLNAITTELTQKLEAGQEVALSPATLAALETINATVTNWPTDFPDATQHAQMTTLLNALSNVLDVKARLADAGGVYYTPTNPLPVDVGGTIDIQNLTVQYQSVESTLNVPPGPLTANQNWVGQWEDVRDYSAISISVFTDAGSAVNGAVLEFSANGVDVISSQASTIPGGISAWYTVSPQARFVRINYTHGPVAMSVLRFQMIFSFTPLSVTQAPLGGPLTDMNAVQVAKSALVGRINSGPYTGMWMPVGVDPVQNRLQVADSGEQEFTHVVTTVTLAGTTTVYTPASGKRIRLRWFYAINDPVSPTSTLIDVKIGADSVYRAWAISKRQVFTGAVDQPLTVTLSDPGNVAVTAILEEV